MSTDSSVYVASALLGAVLGGLISFVVSLRNARRERRARYGEALLTTLLETHRRVAEAVGSAAEDEPAAIDATTTRDEAVALWAQTELASTLEPRAGRRAMQAWSLQLYDMLTSGARGSAQLQWLEDCLDLAVYLVIAWTAGYASGRDFARSGSDVAQRFGPTVRSADMPDYGERPA